MTDKAPDLLEPVIAARGWQFRDGILRPEFFGEYMSMWFDQEPKFKGIWTTGENIAYCGYSDATCEDMHGGLKESLRLKVWSRPTGMDDCSCGFYAKNKPLRSYISESYGLGPRGIRGVVALYGIVQKHNQGWRASRAKVICFVARSPQRRAVAKEAATIYGVPVRFTWPRLTEELP